MAEAFKATIKEKPKRGMLRQRKSSKKFYKPKN